MSPALLLIVNTRLFWHVIHGRGSEELASSRLQTHLGKGARVWDRGCERGTVRCVFVFSRAPPPGTGMLSAEQGPCPETEELNQNNRVGTLDGPRRVGWAGAGAPIHSFDFIHTYSCARDIS